MKTAIHSLLCLFIFANAWAGEILPASEKIPDQYIVVLEESQFAPPGLAIASERRRAIQATANDLAFRYRGRGREVFSEALTGFTFEGRRRDAQALARDPLVAYVAEDAVVEATTLQIQTSPPSWGLDRIDQHGEILDGQYSWYEPLIPTEVWVYVLDTGIRPTHNDFGGRVDTVVAYNAFLDGYDVDDCNGHGTHVAGIIGGDRHGVAKDVNLRPVRVLTCSGRGSLSSVISGIDWVTRQVTENPHPAVANMSLTTGASLVLDNAVRASIAAGVSYVAAAGNTADNACKYSPARIDEVITVGAIDSTNQRAPYSSFGECVDLYAPGTGIASTSNQNDFDALTMSGTSMAAPHVAGIAANLVARAPFATPAQIKTEILNQAGNFSNPMESDGLGALAFSLIDPHPGSPLLAGGLDFSHDCNSKNFRCVFEATLTDSRFEVVRYYWDFGDGSSKESRRPVARNGYRRSGITGQVTIVLAAELSNGQTYIIDKTIDLPF